MATDTFGDVYIAYYNEVAGWSGYTPNKFDSERFQPASVADKGFFLEFTRKTTSDHGHGSGGTELSVCEFELNITRKIKGSTTFAADMQAIWDDLDTAEVELNDLASSRGDVLMVSSITIEKIEGQVNWKHCKISGFVEWRRSIQT